MQIVDDGLPLGGVRVGKTAEGWLLRKEAGFGRDAIVTEVGDWRNHDLIDG
jgi:hypothetical protein